MRPSRVSRPCSSKAAVPQPGCRLDPPPSLPNHRRPHCRKIHSPSCMLLSPSPVPFSRVQRTGQSLERRRAGAPGNLRWSRAAQLPSCELLDSATQPGTLRSNVLMRSPPGTDCCARCRNPTPDSEGPAPGTPPPNVTRRHVSTCSSSSPGFEPPSRELATVERAPTADNRFFKNLGNDLASDAVGARRVSPTAILCAHLPSGMTTMLASTTRALPTDLRRPGPVGGTGGGSVAGTIDPSCDPTPCPSPPVRPSGRLRPGGRVGKNRARFARFFLPR